MTGTAAERWQATAGDRFRAVGTAGGPVGRFGVGFAAVLAVSDEPALLSRQGSVRFSSADARGNTPTAHLLQSIVRFSTLATKGTVSTYSCKDLSSVPSWAIRAWSPLLPRARSRSSSSPTLSILSSSGFSLW